MKFSEERKRYFGTDGIRGVYGEDLTDGLAMLAGNSLGMSAKGGVVVIGRDTRPSGEELARAIAEGALAAGGNVIDLGIATTPCVAFVTRFIGASSGVMVSASHNPPRYNGIKVFGGDGRKLSSAEETVIEAHIADQKPNYAPTRGSVLPSDGLKEAYISNICGRIGRLDGLKVVLDCADGGGSETAPEVFERLGADVRALYCSREGAHINEGRGALHPEVAAREVLRTGASLGLSFDGDADRVIACDENGETVNGDGILFVLACTMKKRGSLPLSAAVGTLHTNLGAERALAERGIALVRTDIGDHNVTRCMSENGYSLGGEQSGHIILGDFLPTGDGVYAGAALAAVMLREGRPLSSLAAYPVYPQRNADILTARKREIATDSSLLRYVAAVEGIMGEGGRVMLRPSGTEPKLRIMTESKDPFLADFAARSIDLFIRTHYELQ